MCEINKPKGLDGNSFVEVVQGKTHDHNQYVFGVHTTRGIILGTESYPVRSVRSERYKLIRNLNHELEFQNVLTAGDGSSYWSSWVRDAAHDATAAKLVGRYIKRPAIEFYDLDRDPFELNNLADNPTYRKEIRKMDGVLKSWMKQQGDLGHETEMTVKPHRTMQ